LVGPGVELQITEFIIQKTRGTNDNY